MGAVVGAGGRVTGRALVVAAVGGTQVGEGEDAGELVQFSNGERRLCEAAELAAVFRPAHVQRQVALADSAQEPRADARAHVLRKGERFDARRHCGYNCLATAHCSPWTIYLKLNDHYLHWVFVN